MTSKQRLVIGTNINLSYCLPRSNATDSIIVAVWLVQSAPPQLDQAKTKGLHNWLSAPSPKTTESYRLVSSLAARSLEPTMPSRISGACNGCRTKKQKCSGDRDGCVQCAAAGIVCTWPEQRKRGPAKGYIEGLEHRLHEAETLLLQLLPIVTPDQLSVATAALTAASMRDSPERNTGRSSPPVLNKKTGIDYWESFPLDTVDNIRRWQADCALHSNFREDIASSSRGGSRPNSVDLQREQVQPHARKQSILSHQQQHFRSMSTDSYAGHSSQNTPTSQPEYVPAPLQAQSQQQWNNGGFIKTDPSTNYMRSGYTGTTDQQWQQQQQQNTYQQQQNEVNMEVDSGFFPSDMKRNLFW